MTRCRYNKINTFWSCENNVTLHELKNALGFQGWVMSDWEAAHSPLSIMRGLDQEMPGYGGAGPAMGTSKIRGGLANHTITLAAIDDAVSLSDHLSVCLISGSNCTVVSSLRLRRLSLSEQALELLIRTESARRFGARRSSVSCR